VGNFNITQGADTFNLDTSGSATVNGGAGGSWTTNQQNQLVISKPDGTSVSLDATWKFTAQNQLTVQAATGQAAPFNFASDAGIRNSYSTTNAVLSVTPDDINAFSFDLHGDWDLDNNHNLTFTANGTTSVINGFVSDPIGRFIYHFANKQAPLQTNVLGFIGSWDVPRDAGGAPVKSGDAMLVFNYQKEDGSTGQFKLPQSAAINRSTNQFTYTYQKDNRTLSIDFEGTLMISPDFQITYVFNRQTSSGGDTMVDSTTIGFDAQFTGKNFKTDLNLTLTRPDGSAGGTTLTVGGNFVGVLGQTKLLVGFSFSQTFGGSAGSGTLTRTAAFNGDLTFANGEIQWKFALTGQTITLAIGVDIKTGPVNIDARLNLTLDHGQVAGITFMLGVSF
jgi:hypothetical protein